MRTTLTLDDDVAKALQKQMRRSGFDSWKAAVNHFLRIALSNTNRPERKPFRVEARPLGLPAGLSYDCVPELLEALERLGLE